MPETLSHSSSGKYFVIYKCFIESSSMERKEGYTQGEEVEGNVILTTSFLLHILQGKNTQTVQTQRMSLEQSQNWKRKQCPPNPIPPREQKTALKHPGFCSIITSSGEELSALDRPKLCLDRAEAALPFTEPIPASLASLHWFIPWTASKLLRKVLSRERPGASPQI